MLLLITNHYIHPWKIYEKNAKLATGELNSLPVTKMFAAANFPLEFVLGVFTKVVTLSLSFPFP